MSSSLNEKVRFPYSRRVVSWSMSKTMTAELVTELLRAGVHPKMVSEWVGHSSVAFTLQRYGHALPDLQQSAADEAERLVGALVRR